MSQSLINFLLQAEQTLQQKQVTENEDNFETSVDATELIDSLTATAKDSRLMRYLEETDEGYGTRTVELLNDAIEALEALENEFHRAM